ncbi:MAG TPA: alpha/beta fold hydrolase [Gemmatimonadaceae bacterium]|nr:alpha/beta fold hydrolase [Gemmatimonadaceae bacterium]
MGRTPADTAGTILAGAGPIDLQEEGSHGALLLHGFGDTPQTLSQLAKRLKSSGYGVYAPLLPGHGRSMAAFSRSGADDWAAAAETAFVEMRRRHRSVSIVGLSMGGALAVALAARVKNVPALALIAPYVEMPRTIRLAASTHWLWGKLAGEISAQSPTSIRDPIEREKSLAYGTVTGSRLYELLKVVRRARKALPHVTAPTLLIQSREDPRCSVRGAEEAMKKIAAPEKKLVWTEGAGHVITVDYGRERVYSEVRSWLDTHVRLGAAAAADDRAAT